MNKTYPGSLHAHSEFSNIICRDSINKIDKLIDRAIELNQTVVGFTEHETVCNAIKIEEYYNKIKANNPNFKVIRGNEIYLTRNGLARDNYDATKDSFYHFILLAKDAEGHRQIRELSTRAWMRSWRAGKITRRPTYYQDLIDIIGDSPGHVIGSSACLGGFLPKKLIQYRESGEPNELWKKIIGWIKQMQGIFGEGNFYLEMQPSAHPDQIYVNKHLKQLANELDIKYIITCDEHYLKKEDRPIHSAFLKSQEAERETDEFYATTYLMDDSEIREYFNYFTSEEIESAYDTILEIKDKCEDYSLLKPLKIPSLVWREPEPIAQEVIDDYCKKIPYMRTFLDSDFEGDQRMVKLVINKFESDERLRNQEHYDMINSNLETTWISSNVNKAHWSAYFLNLQKNIDVCWDSGTLVGPGRGSGVGFLLLYFLDIIQINCLWEETKTYAWRFLNPDRVSTLDVDTDVEGGRRGATLQALRDFYGQDRVANVLTFGTEKSKSAIQTAARGLGIDPDEALYIASLIPSDRGQTRTLKQCYYGDPDNDMEPIALFKSEMDQRPELWEVAQGIEGMVCRVGEHAGGVIFVDEPFTNSTALMRVPNGDVVTQFDLHDDEKTSLIKIDLLSVECLDKIHNELDLLIEYGKIEKKPTLKETYESVIGIYNLERDDPDMWKMVWDHKIQSLFQMEKQSGIQGIQLIHPKSVTELATLNSVIRLMAQDCDSERPLETWAKYRKNINLWYKEMRQHGLTQEEIDWLAQSPVITNGICESQEGLMSLVQEPRLGGNSLTFADRCRKGVAKKQGKLFEECEEEFYKNVKEKSCSEKLAHYVWDVLLAVQRGYSFNRLLWPTQA